MSELLLVLGLLAAAKWPLEESLRPTIVHRLVAALGYGIALVWGHFFLVETNLREAQHILASPASLANWSLLIFVDLALVVAKLLHPAGPLAWQGFGRSWRTHILYMIPSPLTIALLVYWRMLLFVPFAGVPFAIPTAVMIAVAFLIAWLSRPLLARLLGGSDFCRELTLYLSLLTFAVALAAGALDPDSVIMTQVERSVNWLPLLVLAALFVVGFALGWGLFILKKRRNQRRNKLIS